MGKVLIKTSRTNLILAEELLKMGKKLIKVQVVEEVRDIQEMFTKDVEDYEEDTSMESYGGDEDECENSDSEESVRLGASFNELVNSDGCHKNVEGGDDIGNDRNLVEGEESRCGDVRWHFRREVFQK